MYVKFYLLNCEEKKMNSSFIFPKKVLQAYLIASTLVLPASIYDHFNQNAQEIKLENDYQHCVTDFKKNNCSIIEADELIEKKYDDVESEIIATTLSGTMFLISTIGLYAGRRERISKEKRKTRICGTYVLQARIQPDSFNTRSTRAAS